MLPPELRSILDRYPTALQPRAQPVGLGNAGGASGARLWKYPTSLGWVVARAWPVGGRPRSEIERIHGWLREAAPVGFLPVPFPGLDGRTVQETGRVCWELAPWLEGEPDRDRPPSDEHLGAALAGLAAFHRALSSHATKGPSPGLAFRLREAQKLRTGGFAIVRGLLGQVEDSVERGLALRWLDLAERWAPRVIESARPALERVVSLQPVLRDARPEHFLFDGERLTGLVDFGAMDVETVAADLARLFSEWLGPDPVSRAETLQIYQEVRPLDPVETDLIGAFERTAALLGAGRWVEWHFVERRRFDDPEAVRRGLERGLERLESLAEMLGAT